MSKVKNNSTAEKKADNNNRHHISFAAIDPFVVDNIVDPIEREIRGFKWIEWGDRNIYPNYVFDLYTGATTLHTLINSATDYIVGDDVHSNTPVLSDIQARELVRKIGFNLLLTGGVFLNVLRNKLGNVCKIVPIDFRNIRTDKKHEWFYYSEDFGNKSYGRGKYLTYHKFEVDAKDVATSIYYYSNSPYTTYALPCFVGATKACEIEKKISEFHLNALDNGFSSNFVVSFNNGLPSDEIKEEIEAAFMEKFSGVENANRPLFAYSPDKEHSLEITKIDADDFGERFKTLKEDSRNEIFTAFRCSPLILGISSDAKGFATQEYGDTFRIYNRSVILPYQKIICGIIDEILGGKDTITIEPYTLDMSDNAEQVEEITSSETSEQ